MPYVHVRTAGKLSKEQKEKIVEKITDIMEEIAGKPRQYTYVVIEEVETENWGIGGHLLG